MSLSPPSRFCFCISSKPMVAVGFLLVAVSPGAPFAPPLTAISKGSVSVSVGLMVILAASSALLTPLLSSLFMPLIARGSDLKIDAAKIVTTLLMSQLLPLAIGLVIRSKRPHLAQRLLKPSNALTGILSVVVFTLIISLQYRVLADIRARGYIGICVLIFLLPGSRLDSWWSADRDSQGSGLDYGSAQCGGCSCDRNGKVSRHSYREFGDRLCNLSVDSPGVGRPIAWSVFYKQSITPLGKGKRTAASTGGRSHSAIQC